MFGGKNELNKFSSKASGKQKLTGLDEVQSYREKLIMFLIITRFFDVHLQKQPSVTNELQVGNDLVVNTDN